MKQDKLLAETAHLAAAIYKVADNIEAYDAEEKWRTVTKLKNAANDAYFYVAQVLGAGKSQSLEFDCAYARKSLAAVRALYVFATKQNMVAIEPALIVQIDKLIEVIDAENAASQQALKAKTDEEMQPWLKKYKIWQQISKE